MPLTLRSVVATSKDTYSLRYFKVDQDEAEEEE
jgi:large subunit ribosomal protein L22e